MSICVNAQMSSYVRTLFEHPSKWYVSYQENGTKYLKSRKQLDKQLQQQLNACVGEIFLCGLPADITAEKIAEVASFVGEVYILRFKVHFSGASRGFAYLQYIDPNLLSLALSELPFLFRKFHLHMIKVYTSRNSSILRLRKIFNLTPPTVYETLTNLVNFNKLLAIELCPGYIEYQIVFNCNEQAVHAKRNILKSIMKFGPKAIVVWDASHRHRKIGRTKLPEEQFNRKLYLRHQQTQIPPQPLQTAGHNSYRNFLLHTNFTSHNFVNELSNTNKFRNYY